MRSNLVSRKSCLNELLGGNFLINLSASPNIFAVSEILDLVSSWLFDSCKFLTWLLHRGPHNWANGSHKLKEIHLLQTQRLEGERGFVNKVSWAVCWRRIRMKGKSCNEEVTEFCDNNEIMRLKWMKSDLECRSERMCIHVGFYMIQYIWSCEVRWWTLPPQMDLSPCIRVYIRGGCWVSNRSGSCPYDLVRSFRFLSKDL